ncbi:MAG: BC1872 family protein [Bacillota bacterium]
MEYLTPEMIENEPPGVRLDSWVNENVMIVPPLFVYTEVGEETVDYYPQGHRERIAVHDRAMANEVPKYSTDIAAAWKVVETINGRGWPFSIRLREDGRVITECGSNKCNSGVFYHDGAYYSTVPESICKAALLGMLDEANKSGAK